MNTETIKKRSVGTIVKYVSQDLSELKVLKFKTELYEVRKEYKPIEFHLEDCVVFDTEGRKLKLTIFEPEYYNTQYNPRINHTREMSNDTLFHVHAKYFSTYMNKDHFRCEFDWMDVKNSDKTGIEPFYGIIAIKVNSDENDDKLNKPIVKKCLLYRDELLIFGSEINPDDTNYITLFYSSESECVHQI